ncbi:hypothetical protein LCGC14_1232360, partial [marine sediment metagenome]
MTIQSEEFNKLVANKMIEVVEEESVYADIASM